LRPPRGFIVVAVLWILAALSALVLIYLTFVTNTAGGRRSTDRVQTEALLTAGRRAYGLSTDQRRTGGPPDQRDVQCPRRQRQGKRDVPLRGRAH
jgi:hypothetical protein